MKSTVLDRVIGYFSPKSGLERAKLRQAADLVDVQTELKKQKISAASAMIGGYTGAQYRDNLSYWQPGSMDADGNIIRDQRELRARSHDLVRNSPIAAGAIEVQVANVVGTGLSMQSNICADVLGMDEEEAEEWQDNTEREFNLWANSEFCDAFGQLNFAELQDLIFRSHLESGDVGVVLASVKRPNWPFTLALQVIEADRICNERFAMDRPTMIQGIEKTATGAPVAAWIADRHPYQYVDPDPIKWTRVAFRGASGRRNFLHLHRKLRPGQTRGVTCLAPIMEPLKQLDRYAKAEVDAAVNSAVFALFVKMDPDTFQDIFDDSAQQQILDSAQRWDGTLNSGAAVNLLPGEEIQTPDLGRPNPNFDPFVAAVMRQIGVGLNIPYEVLTKHFQSSYSAARAALLDAWRAFRIRRQWLAAKFCQPVYEEWLADAVASGRIAAPGFFADPAIKAAWCGAKWTGDGPGAIDPYKEAEAAEKRISIGLTTLPEEIQAYDGGDWSQKHREQARVQAERVEDGLAPPIDMPLPGAAAPAGTEAPEQGEAEEPKEEEATAAPTA